MNRLGAKMPKVKMPTMKMPKMKSMVKHMKKQPSAIKMPKLVGQK